MCPQQPGKLGCTEALGKAQAFPLHAGGAFPALGVIVVLSGAFIGMFPQSFPASSYFNQRIPHWLGVGGTLKLILSSLPSWVFQYSSSSSLFPFPVVPVSSSNNNPPLWGWLGRKLCKRLMVLFVCMKKFRFKCCGVVVQKCKYFPNYILCAL